MTHKNTKPRKTSRTTAKNHREFGTANEDKKCHILWDRIDRAKLRRFTGKYSKHYKQGNEN